MKNFVGSSLVDAKFVPPNKAQHSNHLPPPSLVGNDNLELTDVLQHRYLLSLEGVDSDTDLLWKLFSNSVVFMANSTYASWAMEPILQPWVHFIPIQPDWSDLETNIRWANNHPQEAKRIAESATLFVYDLLFHPDAAKDEAQIMKRMMYRYHRHVLEAKPVVRWSHIFGRTRSNLYAWYIWWTDDWLRIVLLLLFLGYGLTYI